MTNPYHTEAVQLLDEAPDNPYRLGRHVRHDSRSLAYAIAGLPTSSLVSKRWTRRIPVLDQGNLGSCTGNAAAGWLGTDDATRQGVTAVNGHAVDEALAVSLYSRATQIDTYPGTYPPTDTGSDGLSVAKALQQLGACSGYQHAFSLQAALTALQAGPVMFGTVWYQSMFEPDTASGRLTVDTRSGVAGGHEYVIDLIDVELERIWLTNSWGTGWGLDGRAYLTWKDATILLGQQGDVTVPVPVNVPAPTPTPPAPPTPGPAEPTGNQVATAVRSLFDQLEV